MNQISLGQSGFEHRPKRTRKQIFLSEMEQIVPWQALVSLIEPHYPKAGNGRPPYAIAAMLRIHFMQQWFGLSDPAMEEALHDVPAYRDFIRIDHTQTNLPDETTILRFRRLLETHNLAPAILGLVNQLLAERGMMLKSGTVVDATLIAAPSSTKNKQGKRDPEMHSTQKGNQWHFGMKAHIGVDADSGAVHTVVGTAANVHDITQACELLHGGEQVVFGDAGYQGIGLREDILASHPDVVFYTAMRPTKRKQLDATTLLGQTLEKLEQVKASIRAKVEHPFRVIKRQFGFVKVRYKGIAKNTAQLNTLFALSNLWMMRHRLMMLLG